MKHDNETVTACLDRRRSGVAAVIIADDIPRVAAVIIAATDDIPRVTGSTGGAVRGVIISVIVDVIVIYIEVHGDGGDGEPSR